MNNSKISLEPEEIVDRTPTLLEEEGRLVKIIEAIQTISSSKEWSTLKNTVFDGVVITLENQLKNEASKDKPDTSVLSKINGQLVWARKYSDLDSLGNVFRLELTHVRNQLYGTTQKKPGIQ